MTTITQRIADLQTDAKLLYNVGPQGLLDLANKYGIETDAMRAYRLRPDMLSDGQPLWSAVLGSVQRQKDMQRRLYATIKGQLRKLGA